MKHDHELLSSDPVFVPFDKVLLRCRSVLLLDLVFLLDGQMMLNVRLLSIHEGSLLFHVHEMFHRVSMLGQEVLFTA